MSAGLPLPFEFQGIPSSSRSRESRPSTARQVFTPAVRVTHATPTQARPSTSRDDQKAVSRADFPFNASTSSSLPGLEVQYEAEHEGKDPIKVVDEHWLDEEKEKERKKVHKQMKARERQRRKRERDKRAQEVGGIARSDRMLADPQDAQFLGLPIPGRSSLSAPGQVASTNALSVSVPSPTAPLRSPSVTLGSPLSSYEHTPFAFDPGMGQPTFVSGQPSPSNALFSPFTPAAGTADATRVQMAGPANSIFGREPLVSTQPLATGETVMNMRSQTPLPRSNPAKRRKSEPEPEEFRARETTTTSERPTIRRTISDNSTLPPRMSPSPPPVPDIPRNYRQKQKPSDAGKFFASTVIYGITSSHVMGALQQSLDIGREDLEEMREALAGVFDKFKIERDLRNMSLESREGSQTSSASQSASNSTPTSPATSTLPGPSSFFTPAPPVRASSKVPKTAPTMVQDASGSALNQTSPLALRPAHNRNRSLSSANMRARGLVINPVAPWPDTPPRGDSEHSPLVKTPSTGSILGSHTPDHWLQSPTTRLDASKSAKDINRGHRANMQTPQTPPGYGVPVHSPSQGAYYIYNPSFTQ